MKRKQTTGPPEILSPELKRKPTAAAAHAPNFSSLPKHLVDGILFKLPARSLFRFRLLSRYHLNLIQSPDFIGAHARDSCLNRAGLLVLADSQSGRAASFLPPEIQGKTKDGVLISNFSFPFPFLEGYGGGESLFSYAGSFNGLVCLIVRRRGEYWVLWNPATSHFSFAPPPIFFQEHCICNLRYRRRPCVVVAGFGYDSEADDYKSVRVLCWENAIQVEVLTWAKRYWTKIHDDESFYNDIVLTSPGPPSFPDSPVSTEGRVYWMETSSGMVLSFRLREVNLEWISIPDAADRAHSPSLPVNRTICAWKGSLAMLVQHLQEPLLSVWLYDEGESSWSGLVSIPTHGLPRRVEAIWGVDVESLLAIYVDCIACDSRGCGFKLLPFDVIGRAFEFAPTLLPIPGCS
ncbi:unnamed protein product [Linum trigynum]|uniref:F-box associated beta-propeller type 3 domain-containing protein n=1 Tax=Linum trigynum TaxID=586398 RepID=A0AAV2D3A9_9ROSI